MGCDIHLYVERRKTKGLLPAIEEIGESALMETATKEEWEPADNWTRDPDYPDRLWVDWEHRIWRGRNYDLFAILADVRNGRGFAGVATGYGFNPIAMPKGLPDNVSPLIKESSDGWGEDGHSHSWFTLAELDAYDWTQVTFLSGFVSEKEFNVFMVQGHPNSWCGGVGGGDTQIISNAGMMTRIKRRQAGIKVNGPADLKVEPSAAFLADFEKLKVEAEEASKTSDIRKLADIQSRCIALQAREFGPEAGFAEVANAALQQEAELDAAVAANDIRKLGSLLLPETEREPHCYYTRVSWAVTYSEAAGNFYTQTLPKLREMANGDPTSIRLVFWFDN